MIFTAQSAETAYLKEKICAFVMDHGAVPLNPFMALGYFMFDLVPRDSVRRANNNLIARCDELWCFGPISDGVAVEIALAERRGMPVKYFEMDHHGDTFAETEIT